MSKDLKPTKAIVTRVVSHSLRYGPPGIVTAVTIESGDSEENEDRHDSTIELVVEYKGEPRHKVGDRYDELSDVIRGALEIG